MTSTPQPIAWQHLRYVLVLFAPLWLGSTALFTVAGIGYSLISSTTWTASQPMVLRDETTGAVERLGRFTSQTELKAAQETTLEVASNLEVVSAALKKIGPPNGKPNDKWPSASLVADTAKRLVNITAPQGGEFGGSDMIYLQVEQATPQRSEQFCAALFTSLTEQMGRVRQVRADSMIGELTHARDLARTRLQAVQDQVREIEVQFGSDLGELRNLTEAINGEGANRRVIEETNKELQDAELQLENLYSLREFVQRGLQDPSQLLVSGSDLLEKQPSLQRLKDGLIDAQLARSQLSGNMRPEHPRIRTAEIAEAAILKAIKEEFASVLQSMERMIRLEQDRVARLTAKRQDLNDRLDRLAEVRTPYSQLSSEAKHRTQALEQAERALTDAEASSSAAMSVSLIAKLGPITVSDTPNGPSAKMLAMGGGAAGLIFGLGLVFLAAPGPRQPAFGRRWSDRLMNRRATDRATDHAPDRVEEPVNPLAAAAEFISFRRRASDRLPPGETAAATSIPASGDRRKSDRAAKAQPAVDPAPSDVVEPQAVATTDPVPAPAASPEVSPPAAIEGSSPSRPTGHHEQRAPEQRHSERRDRRAGGQSAQRPSHSAPPQRSAPLTQRAVQTQPLPPPPPAAAAPYPSSAPQPPPVPHPASAPMTASHPSTRTATVSQTRPARPPQRHGGDPAYHGQQGVPPYGQGGPMAPPSHDDPESALTSTQHMSHPPGYPELPPPPRRS